MRLTWSSLLCDSRCVCGRPKKAKRWQPAMCEFCRTALPARLRWKLDTSKRCWLLRYWQLACGHLRRMGDL